MATLKSLVDETTNIKDELIECHNNLKNNLIKKGVECSEDAKMSSLIDEVIYMKAVNFGYGDTLTICNSSFSTPLGDSSKLSDAYYHTFTINETLRKNINTYTISLELSHSAVNIKNCTFTICDSTQNILHQIDIPAFKYKFSISADLNCMPSDNKLGFYMYNANASARLITNCVLSCDIKIT